MVKEQWWNSNDGKVMKEQGWWSSYGLAVFVEQ